MSTRKGWKDTCTCTCTDSTVRLKSAKKGQSSCLDDACIRLLIVKSGCSIEFSTSQSSRTIRSIVEESRHLLTVVLCHQIFFKWIIMRKKKAHLILIDRITVTKNNIQKREMKKDRENWWFSMPIADWMMLVVRKRTEGGGGVWAAVTNGLYRHRQSETGNGLSLWEKVSMNIQTSLSWFPIVVYVCVAWLLSSVNRHRQQPIGKTI